MVARTWESSDMVSGCRVLNGEGGNVKGHTSAGLSKYSTFKVRSLGILIKGSSDRP